MPADDFSLNVPGSVHGDAGEATQLGQEVYQELRKAARNQLRRMRPGQTLDTTALVHEAYLKLAKAQPATWNDRVHFVAVAAVAMRQLLVDYARRLQADKRGGGVEPVTLDCRRIGAPDKALELLAVDQALEKLSALDPRLGRVVDLHFFGGLTVDETAEAVGTSTRTVKRDWRKARAVLYRLLNQAPAS